MSTAAIIAAGVDSGSQREVLGFAIGWSEAGTFRKAFLRSRAERGLRGARPVIVDDHKGLRATASKVFNAILQSCRVHRMRNALAPAPAKQRPG